MRIDKPLLPVVAGVLVNAEQKILLSKRPLSKPMGGLWEFPGGKIEMGESPEAALVRELREELSVIIRPEHLQPLTFVSESYEKFHLLMPVFVCAIWQGEPQPLESSELMWMNPQSFDTLNVPPADRHLGPWLRLIGQSNLFPFGQKSIF